MLLMRANVLAPIVEPPTEGEVLEFETQNIGGPTLQDFKVDFRGSPNSKWNGAACELFEQSFRNVKPRLERLSSEIIQAFKVYMKTLKTRWLQQQRLSIPVNTLDQNSHTNRSAARRTRLRTVS
jgi:hypothetical protein